VYSSVQFSSVELVDVNVASVGHVTRRMWVDHNGLTVNGAVVATGDGGSAQQHTQLETKPSRARATPNRHRHPLYPSARGRGRLLQQQVPACLSSGSR